MARGHGRRELAVGTLITTLIVAAGLVAGAEQEFMAARMGARAVEVDASHLSMISQPEQVTKLILDAATGVH